MQRTLLLLFGFYLSLMFSQAQKPVQALLEDRNSDTQPWEIYSLLLYTYTGADSLETLQQNSRDGLSGALRPSFLETSVFDAQNRKTSWTFSMMETPEWKDQRRNLYTYNSDGLLSSRLLQYNYTGTWEDRFRYDYEYDQNQQKIRTRIFFNDSGNWKASYTELFHYDGFGNLINCIKADTDSLGTVTDSTFREFYTYTLFNKIQTRLIEFKGGPGGWIPQEKYSYTYNLGGSLNTLLKQVDMYGDQVLDDEYKVLYTYNPDGNPHQETYFHLEASPLSGMQQRLTYFYTLSNEESGPQKTLTVYPNPAAELVQADGITGNGTLLLSDLYGHTFQLSLQNGRADISALAAGMYIARIQQKEQTYNGGKLIIAR
ncbi:MAG: T9SS type A sorting domain-containing protein [Bacteroidia bacterium]|nr:T9SS type A sorting domain-containing protein [Bacteroidia bacterium]